MSAPERCHAHDEAGPLVTISRADYQRLLESLELDDMIVICEVCGAWLDRNDPFVASTDDYTGCWKAAGSDPRFANECRSYRASEVPPPSTTRGGHG